MNIELTAKIVAEMLGIGRARLSQIIGEKREEIGPIKMVANVQIFTPEQVTILDNRIKTPGRVPQDTDENVKHKKARNK
jgi:hypothetical protein